MRLSCIGLLAIASVGLLVPGCISGDVENENKVRVSGGLTVAQFPTADEGMGLTGILSVDYDGLPAIGKLAMVTVNGVAIPELPAPNQAKFDVSKVTIPGIAPGATFKVEVKVDDENDGYDLKCPEIVLLNSPEDGATTMNGLMLNVGWIGTLDYGNGAALPATLSVFEYSPAPINRRFAITPPVRVPVMGISSPLTMPATGPTMGTQFMIELAIPGTVVDVMRGAYCTLLRRVRLSKA